MNIQDIDTIIFDMDGVIIDSEPIHMKIESQMFDELNIRISKEMHQSFVGASAKNTFQRLIREFNLNTTPEELLHENESRYLTYLDNHPEIQPIPGVMTLIEDFSKAGFTLLLASSASIEIIDKVLDMFQLRKYFSIAISGARLAHSKPHPEVFYITADKAGKKPAQCLVIEDSSNGVKAAKAAGMYCVAYYNPNSGNQDLSLADKVIRSFDEIYEIIPIS
ncbi:MAG: HAD family phosphatase [Cyclobacteriaceae bacterium]|nr:HAD family phosphatase [Cyclobacteriaceae bacterium]